MPAVTSPINAEIQGLADRIAQLESRLDQLIAALADSGREPETRPDFAELLGYCSTDAGGYSWEEHLEFRARLDGLAGSPPPGER